MKKTGLIFILLLGLAAVLHAAPLRNVRVSLLQPNGDTLHCLATGDEYFNYLHDVDDYVILQDTLSGYYVYALQKGDDIAPSAFIPGRDNPQLSGLRPHTLPSNTKVRTQIAGQKAAMARAMQQNQALQMAVSSVAESPSRNRGTMNNLVIFIRFADDDEFSSANLTSLKGYCNGDDVSMKSYYKEVSYGLFTAESSFYPSGSTLTFSYQDTQDRSYYKKASYDSYEERLKREQTLLRNAIDALKSQVPSDLNIDMNNDGYVDNIIFIVKGDVEGWGALLWPHMWSFTSVYTTLINGKSTGQYNMQLETELLTQSHSSTLCHELFHTLGAPDLYHYETGKDLNPVDAWDLMGYNTMPDPQHMGAYMKHKYGNWIDEIPVVPVNGRYSLYPLNSATSGQVCYRLNSAAAIGDNPEFYVLEYRKPSGKGVESILPGSGMLIYRINPEFNGNDGYNGTTIFDEVYVYRPNGTPTLDGAPGSATFGSSVKRTQFNAATNPKCFLSDGTLDDIDIFDIVDKEDTVWFSVAGMVTSIVIENESVLVGETQGLVATLQPAGVLANLDWSAEPVSGSVMVRGDKMIGQEAGFVKLRVQVRNNPAMYAEKKIIVSQNHTDNPVVSYWAAKGADGLLTIECPEGVSKMELYGVSGTLLKESSGGGQTALQYSFLGYPHGLYFLKVWNTPLTKYSTIKVLW